MDGSRMMSISIFVAAAIFLVLLLLALRSGEAEEQVSGEAQERCPDERRNNLLPLDLVVRIFSRADREFIRRMRSPRLQRIYTEERRKVALHWVRRTSAEVSRIMRTHRLASRQSKDLDAAAEANLLFQYLKLKLVLGILVLLIASVGPDALDDLAAHASELYQRIGRALPEGALGNNPATSGRPASY
jgi:hypothetical protein